MLNDNSQAVNAFLSVFQNESFSEKEIIGRIKNSTAAEDIAIMLSSFSKNNFVTPIFFSEVINKTDPEKRMDLIKHCLLNASINKENYKGIFDKFNLDFLEKINDSDFVKNYKKFHEYVEVAIQDKKTPKNNPSTPISVDLSKIPKILDL